MGKQIRMPTLKKATKAEVIDSVRTAAKILDNALADIELMEETEGHMHMGPGSAYARIQAALRQLGSEEPRHWEHKYDML